jgi:hypothetical protein
MMRRIYACPIAAFIGVLALASLVHAQAASATVGGTVLDESSAVVPDAQITVVNLDTELRRATTTDARGGFAIPLLSPGRYRVTAERDGFRPAEIAALDLNVGDNLGLRLVLKVPRVGESVTVSAEAARVSTSPSVSTVVDRTFVGNLPLNGRSFQSLITMTPGVVTTPASSTSPGQFSVNGQRSDANYFMVDGVSANVGVQPAAGLGILGAGAAPGLSVQGGTNSLVSVDALQEFRIETSTYAPEFGRMPGGQISMVTRSGTNQFHGSLFEYFRNDALDSADYFVTRQGLSKPKEHQHDFGGVFGGPIERDRMFVFVSYEGLRLDQPRSAVTEVPSLSSRAAASDVLKPFFAAFPSPNGPETASGLAQFSASYSDPSTLDATSVRVDRTFGGALTVFGRYNYAPSDGSSRLGSFGIASANTVGTVQTSLQTFTVGATWIIGPTLANDLRVNWSRNAGTNFQTLDTFGGAVVPSAATLHPAFAPAKSGYQFILGTPNGIFADGLNSSNLQRQVNIVDAVTMTKARHQVKLGIDFRHLFPIYGPVGYVQAYGFNGVAGALARTASFIVVASTSTSNRSSHSNNFSAYAQDTWSPTSRLTLTYGVRWDVNPPPGLSDSNEALTLTSADPTRLALAAPGTPMYETTYNNFAPRLGAGYRLREGARHEMVLRGGWGVFFDLGSGPVTDNLAQTFPFTARRLLLGVPFPTDPALLAPATVAPGAPVDFLTAADPNLKLPYTYQWNVAVEQAFGAADTMTVSYVGALGRRLLRQEQLLDPTPQFQQLVLITNHAHSRYNALQVKYTRRLSKGLQALASYTLAHSMDNISNDTLPVLPSFRVNPEEDWGPSDFDARHTLSGGVTYAFPTAPSGSLWHGVASGWSVDAVFTARSALPVNVLTGADAFGVSDALRPDVVTGMTLYVDDDTVPGGRRFNRAAFAPPPVDADDNPLRQGTLGRNALRGFAMSQVDLAVRRDIPLSGGVNVQLRVEAFNLFNQVNFGAPTNALSSGLFGQATRALATSLGAGGVAGGGFSPLYQVGGPRSVQLALRLQF